MNDFWKGFASVFDLTGQGFERDMKEMGYWPLKNDKDALRGDWEKIGGDMRKVLDGEQVKAGLVTGARLADRGMTLAEDTVKVGKGLLFWLKAFAIVGILLVGAIIGAIGYGLFT